MNVPKTLVVAAAVLLVTIPAPAHAQRRAGGGSRAVGRGPGSVARSGSPRSFSAPRTAGPRIYGPRVYGPSSGVVARSRSFGYGGPRVFSAGPRGGVVVGRAVPRVVGPGGVRSAPFRFYRPYYAFRPRFNVGLGLWVGFPVAYPYYGYYSPYYGPYAYGSPYPYSYQYPYSGYAYAYPSSPAYPAGSYPPSAPPPPAGSVELQPGQANMGGVSFEITPGTAEVFVDGSYVGTVDEFGPTSQPLGLTPGRHRIEIRAAGYQSMVFGVDIAAGQVIPYRGILQQ